jgi:Sulfotransferase family
VPDTGPQRPSGGRGPIFVLSAMGSGSTLLRLILDSHDNIAIPQETGFMRAYNAHQFVPLKWSGRNWARRMGWSREELDVELAAFYDRIFQRYVQAHGKQRWGDKTPLHTWHVDGLARLFPEAPFVGIVRHPGGNVNSNMNRFGHSFGRAVVHVDRYDREIARQAARHRDRFVLVRYEELVLSPEPLLRELLDWLGEPWSDRVLQHHSVQTGRGGRVTVEGKNRIDDPIDVSRIDKWFRTLPQARRPALARRLGRLAEFYGYSIGDPAVLGSLSTDGRLLIRGSDIEARIDEFPDLDLRAEPDPPLAERFYHPGRMQLHSVLEPKTPSQAQETEPGVLVRAWRVLPRGARKRLHPLGRRVVRRFRRAS